MPRSRTYEKGQQGRVIAMAARKRSALLPDVPTLYEALKLDKEQEWWLDFRAELNEYGRVLLTMPGIPADRLAYLRASIAQGADRSGRDRGRREDATLHRVSRRRDDAELAQKLRQAALRRAQGAGARGRC